MRAAIALHPATARQGGSFLSQGWNYLPHSLNRMSFHDKWHSSRPAGDFTVAGQRILPNYWHCRSVQNQKPWGWRKNGL